MNFIKVKTRPILPPKDNIYPILDKYMPKLKEGDVVFITSKILGIHQGRCIPVSEVPDKDKLVIEEADMYIPRSQVPFNYVVLTLKDYTLIPTSGIDASNANGYYVLWPTDTQKLLKEIWSYLRRKHKIKNLGVIATDSHSTPLRYGVIGISTGFFGIKPLFDYRGQKDIFGRELKVSQVNVIDALSATAVFLMGEGNERTPILIGRDIKQAQFTNRDMHKTLVMPPEDDLYYPLFKAFRKKK